MESTDCTPHTLKARKKTYRHDFRMRQGRTCPAIWAIPARDAARVNAPAEYDRVAICEHALFQAFGRKARTGKFLRDIFGVCFRGAVVRTVYDERFIHGFFLVGHSVFATTGANRVSVRPPVPLQYSRRRAASKGKICHKFVINRRTASPKTAVRPNRLPSRRPQWYNK